MHVLSADAPRIVDEEISVHDATILKLNTRRNTYSPVSKLPVELLSRIFLLWKQLSRRIYLLNECDRNNPWAKNWLNVSGVCRRWREVVLNTPLLWCSIKLGPGDRVLEMLRRSKSAPLQIRCESPSYDHGSLRPIAEAVMLQIKRIQSITVDADNLDALLGFLRLNPDASAPQLECLALASGTKAIFTTNALWPDMPALRTLTLCHIHLSSELPPLPRLSQLVITQQRFPLSLLLASLRHTANIEELYVSSVVTDISSQTSTSSHISLDKLSSVLVKGYDIQSCKIFGHIDCPKSAYVGFAGPGSLEGLDLSGLENACSRLAAGGPPLVSHVLINHTYDFDLQAWLTDATEPCMSFSLPLPAPEAVPAYVRLCSMLPLATVPHVIMKGVVGMSPEFIELLDQMKHVTTLLLVDGDEDVLVYLRNEEQVPLPKLKTLKFRRFLFNYSPTRNNDDVCDALLDMLFIRDLLGVPVEKVVLMYCRVSEAFVNEIAKFVEVEWDGDELSECQTESESEMEELVAE